MPGQRAEEDRPAPGEKLSAVELRRVHGRLAPLGRASHLCTVTFIFIATGWTLQMKWYFPSLVNLRVNV